jgi:hypothetical protein
MKLKQEERQTGLPGFGPAVASASNADLVGRSFSDGAARLKIVGVSSSNPAHVVVERDADGHSFTIPAGIVRIILGPAKRRRAA